MEEIRESLGDMYDALEKVRKGMDSIQGQTHEMEDSYQKLMIMYIKELVKIMFLLLKKTQQIE